MYQLCIVCRHQLIREALGEIVRKSPATVVGEGADLSEVLDSLDPGAVPHMIVFDSDSDLRTGSELTQIQETTRRFPSTKIVILADAFTAETAVLAIRAGSHALLSRHIPSDMFQKALHFVMAGQILLPAAMAKLMVENPSLLGQATASASGEDKAAVEAAEAAPEIPTITADIELARPDHPVLGRAGCLSERESQILQCLVKGFSNKIIARHLNLAEATVKVHIKSVLRKLQAANRTQAAVWALNNSSLLERTPELPAGTASPSLVAGALECRV